MSGPRTQVTREMLAFIQEHQPVLQTTLLDKYRPQAAAAGMSASRWVWARLQHMQDANYIQHTARGWVVCPSRRGEPRLPGEPPRTPRQPRPKAPAGDTVAQPRRTSMFGAPYVPPATAHRPGSQDYAQLPSLINGEARPYRRAW